MLRIYVSPDGSKYQYEEGEQPEDYVLLKEDKPRNKARRASNKKATTAKKAAEDKE